MSQALPCAAHCAPVEVCPLVARARENSGETPDLVVRTRMRTASSRAVHYARRGEPAGIGERNHLQRVWRDINTSSLHAILTHRTTLELYGRLLPGPPRNSPPR